MDTIQNLIDLKLSNIADSFKLVMLETSNKSIINANDFYVSKKFIIAFSEDGIYKFSSNGKFLSKIISWGRGPDEISGFMFSHFYDEKKDLLFIEDVNLKNKLLVYDLQQDKFVAPIKKAIQGSLGSFAIYNDSLIISKSPSYGSEPYAVFLQTFDGRFVSGIPNLKKVLMGPNPIPTFQNSYISIAKNDYRISFEFDDTLYTFKNNNLVPFVILYFKKQRERPPNARVQKGDRSVIFPKIEPKGFLIIRVKTIDEITWFTPTSGKSIDNNRYLLINRSTHNHALIRSYEDDFLGQIQSPDSGTIKFPTFLKNGNIVVIYQPQMIKQLAEKEFNNPAYPLSLKKELFNISKNLQETDNPILLIGRIKEVI